ncbi:ECF transporter S component [Enterococcus faecalis]|nr:ECF transporter S component [Enterococcus faecalis]
MNKKTYRLVLTATFLSIILLMSAIPFLGFIPLGVLNITTMHIPVIIGSIILGPLRGAFLGGIFGLLSLWKATTTPTTLSFIFSPFIPVIGSNHGSWKSLIIVLVPRILIGVVPYYVYNCLKKIRGKENSILLMLSGIAGSLTNTLLVMNLIYFLFKSEYSDAIGKSSSAIYSTILAIILTNGLPEAIVAGIITTAVGLVLLKYLK